MELFKDSTLSIAHKRFYKLSIILLIAIFIMTLSKSENLTEVSIPHYYPVYDDNSGMYGYVDNQMNWVISPRFRQAYEFSDGVAAVDVNDNRYLINQKGKIVLKPNKWNPISPSILIDGQTMSSSDGLIRAVFFNEKDKKIGFINTQGKWIIRPQFSEAGDFNDGFAYAKSEKTSLYGIINKKGEWVIQPNYDNISVFYDGLSCASKKNGKTGFINDKGDWVIAPNFYNARGFFNNLAPATKDGILWGLIDKKGDWAVKPQFEEIFMGREEGYCAQFDGYYGLIDGKGNWLIPPKYIIPIFFEEGLARTSLEYDREGHAIYGCIDKYENWIIPPEYYYIEPFIDGIAKAQKRLTPSLVPYLPSFIIGYINTNGEWLFNWQIPDSKTVKMFAQA